ncbi:MAG TPA: response regulator [Bryobacteraceae bacterium]|nr:response regulator [Bryobacteraceae bacterium]
MALTASSTVPRGDETILMVEPDPETRALAVFMLSRLGYRVLEARNAVDAVKLYSAQTERVDLLFTETLMSKVNGHELAQILTRETPQLRVLYLSDTGYERLTRKVAQQKGLHFLSRPFTMRMLAAKVREVLDVPMARAVGVALSS